MNYESIKVKLDPTPKQIRVLNSHIGGARFAYNTMLNYISDNWEEQKSNLSGYSIRNTWNKIKKDIAPWYKENYKDCYAEACFDLAKAFKNYFNGKNGKRRDKPGFPKFKKKHDTGSFRLPWNPEVSGTSIFLSKRIGKLHCFESVEKRVQGRKIKYVIVSFDGLSYYANLLVETDYPEYSSYKSDMVGVDLGVKNLATLSDGTIYDNNKYLSKYEKRLKRYQRMMSRKQGFRKGEAKSNRYKKAQHRLRKLHNKITNCRKDNIEKITTDICKTYKNISIENLKIKNMAKNYRLAKSVNDSSMRMFRECLERKAQKYENAIYIIDTYYPSSKTCSNCGQVKTKLNLNERTYICEQCGYEIDRDLNAAINLKQVAESASETLNGHGENIRHISLSTIKDMQISMKCQSGNQIRPEALDGNIKIL